MRNISAAEIARALARDGGKLILPTPEQELIIESRHFGPTVIIAGAGSGKTETISQRVLWLVANGIVKPEQILGLTFTRKAASELTARIRTRLRQLKVAGLLPDDPSTGRAVDISVDVSTYHSYAGRTLGTHGIRMGIDTDGEPLGEAAGWQMASEIVGSFDELLRPIGHKPPHVIDALIHLSGEFGEHNQSAQVLLSYLEELEAKFLLHTAQKSNEEVRTAIAVLQERIALIPMLEKLERTKLELGQLSFNDQMAYAAQLVESVPEIGEIERAKYPVVLLDEYQDTSYSQVRFLSSLFGHGNHHVTAVGDPNQAIYGWRGATAATLETFSEHFGAETKTFDLLTTWRNDRAILEIANRVVEHGAALVGSSRNVKTLGPRPNALAGDLRVALYPTLNDEAQEIARQFQQLWNDPARLALPSEKRSTFAVLLRVKSYIPEIEAALRAHGLKTEVVGMSGLIHVPEIADIIALLRTLVFPDSGTALARLILGPRLALGAKDLAALGRYSQSLARASEANHAKKLEEAIDTGGDSAVMESDDFSNGSIIEALANIVDAPAQDFSPEGLRRLREFSQELTALRREAYGSLTDIVLAAERFLRLDTELLVRDGQELGRRHIEKFLDEAAAFSKSGANLSAFLGWLDTAEEREGGLKPAQISVSHDAVQILTVHNSKGAEWDVVAVPGLVADLFPNKGRSDSWLKYSGSLPIALRGDRLQFNDFEFPDSANCTPAEIKKALARFEESWALKKHAEELRLGYVAFTRAKSHLLLSATYFREGSKAVNPSILFTLAHYYLAEQNPAAISIASELPTENPLLTNPPKAQWPVTSKRATEIRASADLVKNAKQLSLEELESIATANEKEFLDDAHALLRELHERSQEIEVYLPQRLSVSTLVALRENPSELALAIRRPMPRHTDRYAARGTEFHLWLERHFESETLFDDDLFEPEPLVDITLKELQDKWLASPWAAKQPHEVEAGFEMVIEGVVLKGRIDAIYKDGDRYEVIDWKTGRTKSGEDLESASIQLAMYRLAYAKLHGIELSKIRAGFYYVASGEMIYRDELSEEEEIAAIIQSVTLTSGD
jgi:DNA helicase-2/ATP-dependent DNA helicase PcrA